MPSLIVFDLDLTLWHCGPRLWCDQLRTPLSKTTNNTVCDADGIQVSLFADVPLLLEELHAKDTMLALASRTSAPEVAKQLLNLLDIDFYFSQQEIYPGEKSVHFEALQRKTGIPYEEMLFFDDEQRNIAEVSSLGVQCHLVTHGLTRELFELSR